MLKYFIFSVLQRCAEVLQDPRLNGTDTAKLINDFNILAEKMIDLTNKTIPNGLQVCSIIMNLFLSIV